MTDRIHSFTVALSDDLRVDDADALRLAITQMRGVAEVSGNVTDTASFVAMARARTELGQALLDVLYPKRKGAP